MVQRAAVTMEWVSKIGVPVLLAIVTFLLNTAAQELRDLRSEVRLMRTEFQTKLEKLQIEHAVLSERVESHLKVKL